MLPTRSSSSPENVYSSIANERVVDGNVVVLCRRTGEGRGRTLWTSTHRPMAFVEEKFSLVGDGNIHFVTTGVVVDENRLLVRNWVLD